MRVISVNVGREEPLANAKAGTTGIFKRPVAGSVEITAWGFVDDHISDTRNHGGPDQAVYLYTVPDYDWWIEELREPMPPGTFGENLTVSDLESASACIGDRFRIGDVLLEVTAPRIPCVTLARRMDDTGFVKRFIEAERPGLYCRVLQTGSICAGTAAEHIGFVGNDPITAREMFRDFFGPGLDENALRRYLANPIAMRARAHLEKQLANLLSSGETHD